MTAVIGEEVAELFISDCCFDSIFSEALLRVTAVISILLLGWVYREKERHPESESFMRYPPQENELQFSCSHFSSISDHMPF